MTTTKFDGEWYVSRDGRQFGPFADHELRDLVQNNQVGDNDYVWCAGFTNWIRFGSIVENEPLATSNGPRFQFLRSFKRFLNRRVFAERVSIFKKIGLIVSRPSEFADKYIKDGKPAALFDAMKFYIKAFAITFVVIAIGSRLSVASGTSEVRSLIRLVPQLIIGTIVIFLLLRMTRNRVPFGGLVQ